MKLLQQLWDLADRNPKAAFWKISLELIRPLSTWPYNCTPMNSSTFATNGRDGDHFGLIHINGEIRDESPVVMTVPMECGEINGNIIVGSNLYEFLCLGCEYDYASLEYLPSNRRRRSKFEFFQLNELLTEETMEDGLADQEHQECLALLIAGFDLKPWTNIGARLNELQEQYLPLLQLKDW